MKQILLLFFLCCIACKNTENNKLPFSSLSLTGKKFSYNTDVSYINSSVCEFSCECDCGLGDFIFDEGDICYFSDYCCCGNPETYYKGKYRISGVEVICEFAKQHVLEYDAATTKMNEQGTSPIKPVPIVKEGNTFTYRFKVGYCAEGQLYLYDVNLDKTYLRLKSTISPNEFRFNAAVDVLLKSI
jgi:hypothetical protein